MNGDLRRARAVARDDWQLRSFVAGVRDRQFDVATADEMRQRANDLLETLGFIAIDDALWKRLEVASAADDVDAMLAALSGVGSGELTLMLQVSGYRSPPPPPIDELVEDTRLFLREAVAEGAAPQRLGEAQKSLALFVQRVSRQVSSPKVSDDPGVMAALARQVGRSALEILPVVAGVAAGAGVATVFPPAAPAASMAAYGIAGQVLGNASSKAAAATVEQFTKVGMATAIGAATEFHRRRPIDSRAAERIADHPLPTPDEVLSAHVAQASTIVGDMIEWRVHLRGVPTTGERVTEACRHLARVRVLAVDHSAEQALADTAELGIEILETLAHGDADLSGWRIRNADQRSMLEVLTRVLELAREIRGRDSEFGRASYTSAPFADEWRLDLGDRGRQVKALWDAWDDLNQDYGHARRSSVPQQQATTQEFVGQLKEKAPPETSQRLQRGFEGHGF